MLEIDEIEEAMGHMDGWCTNCKCIVDGPLELDATGCECDVCGQNTVIGIAEALLSGEF
jgi:hypothetical protein